MSYPKKTRNMVRRAQRDGVVVRELEPTQADLRPHARAHPPRSAGGDKEGLMLKPKPYVESVWRGFAERGQGRFFGIETDGTIAVMAFVIRSGTKGFYKDGGSERELTTPGMYQSAALRDHATPSRRGRRRLRHVRRRAAEATSNADHVSFASGNFKLTFGPRTTFIGASTSSSGAPSTALWQRIGSARSPRSTACAPATSRLLASSRLRTGSLSGVPENSKRSR